MSQAAHLPVDPGKVLGRPVEGRVPCPTCVGERVLGGLVLDGTVVDEPCARCGGRGDVPSAIDVLVGNVRASLRHLRQVLDRRRQHEALVLIDDLVEELEADARAVRADFGALVSEGDRF